MLVGWKHFANHFYLACFLIKPRAHQDFKSLELQMRKFQNFYIELYCRLNKSTHYFSIFHLIMGINFSINLSSDSDLNFHIGKLLLHLFSASIFVPVMYVYEMRLMEMRDRLIQRFFYIFLPFLLLWTGNLCA